MKLLAIFMLFISFCSLPFNGEVISNRLTVYESVLTDAEELGYLYHGDEVNVIGESGIFYEIDFENQTGFVIKDFVMEKPTGAQVVHFPEYNGKTKRTTKALEKIDGEYYELSFMIEPQTEIKILDGYDTDQKFTQITFVKDEKLFVCYVLTTDITPYGINPNIIIAFSLIITIVGIFLILFGLRKSRVKKKRLKA